MADDTVSRTCGRSRQHRERDGVTTPVGELSQEGLLSTLFAPVAGFGVSFSHTSARS